MSWFCLELSKMEFVFGYILIMLLNLMCVVVLFFNGVGDLIKWLLWM